MKTDPEDFKWRGTRVINNDHQAPKTPEPKKFTSQEAIDMATKAVAGLGEYYQEQIDKAEARGYQKAIDEMHKKLATMFYPVTHKMP